MENVYGFATRSILALTKSKGAMKLAPQQILMN
jgi:hypothetical protein